MPSSSKVRQPWDRLLPGRQGHVQGADTTGALQAQGVKPECSSNVSKGLCLHPGTLASQASSSATFSFVPHGRGGPHRAGAAAPGACEAASAVGGDGSGCHHHQQTG